MICKFDKNYRKPTLEQIIGFVRFHEVSEKKIIIDWYLEKISQELKHTEFTSNILEAAEEKINYYKAQENGK